MKAVGTAALLATLVLSSCEDDAFPEVQGRYAFEATVDGATVSEFHAIGDLFFLDVDEDTGRLDGYADITVHLGNDSGLVSQIENAFVSDQGEISFRLPVPNASTTWTFVGRVDRDGDELEGTHTLRPSTGATFGGPWRADRR